MNWRAVGCAAAGIGLFVAIGVLGLVFVLNASGCPRRVPWGTVSFLPEGAPAASPSLAEGEPIRIGSIFVGVTTRDLFGPPGTEPIPSGATELSDPPDSLVLDCGDGSFQTYRPAA